MRRKFKPTTNYRYSILNPTGTGRGKRPGFRIEKRTFDKNWKTVSSELIEHPTITSINSNLLAKIISEETARKNLEELVDELYKDAKAISAVIHNNENQQLLEQYWKSQYEDQNRDLVDPKTARYELERAVDAVGNLSLHSASKKDLQDKINSSFKGNKQRRIVAKLNLLLRHAKRTDVKLLKAKKEKKRVKHLSNKEFELVLIQLDKMLSQNIHRLAIIRLHQVCFYTGCRIGEAFALELSDLDEDKTELKIAVQVDKLGLERDTKNKTDRISFIFPEGIPFLKDWVKLKHDIPATVRNQMARITKQACEAAFPGIPEKHLKFHDMRHCYAISLLSKGVSLDHVAQMIGDSVITCKEYYVGSHISSDSMSMVRSKVLGG